MVKKVKKSKKTRLPKNKKKHFKFNKNLIIALVILILVIGAVIIGIDSCANQGKFTSQKPLNIPGQVVRTISKIYRNGDVKQYTFYFEGKKIATQNFKKNGAYANTSGRIPDGLIREYYDKAHLKAVARYEKGKRNGVERVFYQQGQLMGMLYFSEEDLTPKAFVYYPSGELYSQWRHDKAAQKGKGYIYYKDGTLLIEVEFKDGNEYLDMLNNKIQIEG
jgi:antitoxin component YwqK of YwqJK toxin-antitoxin module